MASTHPQLGASVDAPACLRRHPRRGAPHSVPFEPTALQWPDHARAPPPRRPHRPAPATVTPEDAARAARCAAKQAELERLHAEIAEVRHPLSSEPLLPAHSLTLASACYAQVERACAAGMQALESRRATVAATAAALRGCNAVDPDLEFAAHVAAARKVPLLAGGA